MTLASFQRRQALFMRGAAADWIDDKNASIDLPRPPHPTAQKASPVGGFSLRSGGEAARFSRSRVGVACAEGPNPWIFRALQGAPLGFTKAIRAFATFSFPRVALIFPRVGLFSPRVCFSAFAASFSFFSLLHRERERKEGREAVHVDPRVEYVTRGYKTYRSWKKRVFPRVSVDGWRGGPLMNQGLTRPSPEIHGSTGVLPPSPLAVALFGGAHGGC